VIEELIRCMKSALKDLDGWHKTLIHIFHHNDTDGLTSGAILTQTFERMGYSIKRYSLEKPYPMVLKKIFAQEGEILIFADFAGRIAPLISKLNMGRNLVLILDHHTALEATDPRVYNLDPDLFGLKGDLDISASVTCYNFAKVLDRRNVDLAYLAALGAVGDKFFLNGRLVGENRRTVFEAIEQGQMKIEEKAGGEDYLFKTSQGDVYGLPFSEYIETLGGVGYYQNGPETGIDVCLKGFSAASNKLYSELMVLKEERFYREIEGLKSEGLQHSANIQWFHVQNRLSPMGVKMIGVLCESLKNMDFICSDKYIAGFQLIPNEIPGFGPIELNEVKISMRVSDFLAEQIRNGSGIGINDFLPEATTRLGGFSDACHRLTAASTVAIGREEGLIDEMEKILKS